MSKTSQRRQSARHRINTCYEEGRKNKVPKYPWFTETEYRRWLLGVKHYMKERDR